MGKEKHIREEAFYHFIWQHKLYRKNNLKTVDGLPIEVIHPGLLNHNAGPDFFNAKIKINNVLWAGNVEIHCDSADWNRHQHQHDKNYDNVILHVVGYYSVPVKNSHGNTIPTLVLDIPTTIFERYDSLLQEKQTIACHHILSEIDPLFLINFSDRLVSERLQRKSTLIEQILLQTNGDWETVFFQLLCRNFGFGTNADAFERLGKSLSYKIIAKHRDNILQIEALFFGQAGFLEEEIEDSYYQELQKEYHFLKTKYTLSPLEKHLWKFLRLRPVNFPTIRLAQLAYLLHKNEGLLHKILKLGANSVKELFNIKTSQYWETHYHFGQLSELKKKRLGKTSANTILVNTVAPILFCYGKRKDDIILCEEATTILEMIPAERNHIINKWQEQGFLAENAYDTQAQIQLYNEYCLHKKCLHCDIGKHFLSLQQ